MRDLGHELETRIAASQRLLEAQAASPLDGTEHMIRRNRGIRQSAAAGAAVLGIAAIVVAGILTTGASRDVPPATPEPAPSIREISISADGPNPTVPNLGIACGDPAPVAAPSAGGFDLQVTFDNLNPSAAAEGYIDGSAKVTSKNVPAVPAFALHPAVVVVSDGVVVGVIQSAGLVNPVSFADGRDLLVNAFWVGSSAECDGDPEGHDLEPGNYQFYVVSTVAYSPTLAALAPYTGTRDSGLWFPEDPWLEPGDWECSHYVTWDAEATPLPYIGTPAACLARDKDSVAWDAAARSVALALVDDSGSPEFNTQLIAGPFDYELSAAATAVQTEGEFVVDACDAMMRWDEDANSVAVYPRGMDRVLRDGGGSVEALVWPTFGPYGVKARSAQVQAPDRGRAVIIAQEELVSDDGSTVGARYIVVGHAVVTLNHGDEVTVTRALGPAHVPVDIEDVTWCAGEAPPGLGIGAVSMTVFPDELVDSQAETSKLRFYGLG